MDDKIAFQSSCKFALAIENSSSSGYCTEKFAQAAQSNCVPIYWGDPTIAQQFNPKSFINAHDYESFNDLTDTIRQIDQDENLYLSMLKEPWLINGKEAVALNSASFPNFLTHIFSSHKPRIDEIEAVGNQIPRKRNNLLKSLKEIKDYSVSL